MLNSFQHSFVDHTYGIFIWDATFIPPIKIGGYDFVHA